MVSSTYRPTHIHYTSERERERERLWNRLEVKGGVGKIIVVKINITFLYLTLSANKKQLTINF